MTAELKLENVDVDGALRDSAREAGASLEGDTRADLFKKAGIAGGAVIGGGSLLSALVPSMTLAADGRPPKSFGKGDIGILNYALTLEYLEAAFYNEATRRQKNKSFIKDRQIRQLLRRVTADENVHVKTLKGLLGHKAVAKPKFDFGGANATQAKFIKTAFVLENEGVHAYSGQALNINSAALVKAAVSIVTVEARHASVAGLLYQKTSKSISPDGAFDVPFTAEHVLRDVKRTGFIKS